MKQLWWSTPDNPCLLCGVPVTPAGWLDGIVEHAGRWYQVQDIGHADQLLSLGWGHSEPWQSCTPIFPPRGWAGKSRDEIWREMCGGITPVDIWQGAVLVGARGTVHLQWNNYHPHKMYNQVTPREVADPPALILALQKAQVLAAAVSE